MPSPLPSQSVHSSQGIVYIASGSQHLREVERSIQSVRLFSSIPITVITDHPDQLLVDAEVRSLEPDHMAQQGTLWDRVRSLQRSPYRETLFLDTDTLMLRPDMLRVFELLRRFDMALALAPSQCYCAKPSLPAAFPHYNGGVILLHDNDAVRRVLDDWQTRYLQAVEQYRRDGLLKHRTPGDQGLLTEAIYHAELRVAALGPEWNYRAFQPNIADLANIRILHSRRAQQHVFAESRIIELPVMRKRLTQWFLQHATNDHKTL